MSIAIMTSHSTPIHLAIPPIAIPTPVFRPEKPSNPVLQINTGCKEQLAYYKNYVDYDFPSPVCTHYSTCDTCDISFEIASTRDNETCVSCEIIQSNHRWHSIPLPKCSICETDCYYIHRQCSRPICKHCKYNFQACPHCKYPI